MKRLLSLLVVIAMMVSLMPNVFAAKEEVDFDELTGRLVVLEDIDVIEVTLAEGSDGMIYQWTPYANVQMTLNWTAPEGTDISVVVTQGETTTTAVSGESIIVYGEQLVEIEVSEAAALAAAFQIDGEYGPVEGTEEAPFSLPEQVNNVTAAGTVFTGNTTWYQTRHNGPVVIEGQGAFNVIYNGETIAAVDGKVEIVAVSTGFFAPPSRFAIDTVGEYTITLIIPEGARENPAELVIGENVADIKAGSEGYFFTWIATEEGTLKITMPEGNWSYTINNMTTCQYGDTQWSDSDPVVNPAEIAVAAGDEIQVIVNTYDPADRWNNPAGEITFTAEFVKPEPPAAELKITAQPQSVIVKLNDTASFTVVAEGDGLTYQWQYSNNGGSAWANTGLTGFNTATLTPAALASRHNYQYRCIVTDAHGAVLTSAPAVLQIPFITEDPTHAYVLPGDTAEFNVKFSVEGATYQWQYKNPAVGVWFPTSATGYNTATLQYPVKDTNNQYQLRCIVTYTLNGEKLTFESGHGAVKHNGEVPNIAGQPNNIGVRGGATAPFTVTTDKDYRSVSYQWEYQKPGYDVWWETRMPGCNEPTLNVLALYSRNGYKYRCIIRTPGQKIVSEEATLTVLPAADITLNPVDQTVAVGETATFTAAGTCDEQTVTYQWQYSLDGVNWSNTTVDGATTDTLNIVGEARLNGRYYRCRIRNEHNGEVFTEAARLYVQ